MNLKCLFGLHIWNVLKVDMDPLQNSSPFAVCNYIVKMAYCDCVRCGKTETIKRTKVLQPGTPEFEEFKARESARLNRISQRLDALSQHK
jgi:hypothetical protein